MATIFDILKSMPAPEDDHKYQSKPEVYDYYLCSSCHEKRVETEGAICQRCQADQARGYQVLTLAGRCANGSELGCGTRFHAVPLESWKAICGAKPGRRSAGWSSWKPEGQQVTCPRCLKKI